MLTRPVKMILGKDVKVGDLLDYCGEDKKVLFIQNKLPLGGIHKCRVFHSHSNFKITLFDDDYYGVVAPITADDFATITNVDVDLNGKYEVIHISGINHQLQTTNIRNLRSVRSFVKQNTGKRAFRLIAVNVLDNKGMFLKEITLDISLGMIENTGVGEKVQRKHEASLAR